MKYLYVFFVFVILSMSACQDNTPYSPQDLASLYWESLENKDFKLTKPYWASIRELNKLIEIMPALGRHIDKGALYSESGLVNSEKEIFKKVLSQTLSEELKLNAYENQDILYNPLFKEQGVEVGQVQVTTDFRSKTLKIRLLVVYSGHRWRYLGLYYARINQTGFDAPEDNAVDM